MAKRWLICVLFVAVSSRLFATDSEPVMKTKLCNPAETYCADVTSGLRAKTDADVTSAVLPVDLNATGTITTICATPTASCTAGSTVELALRNTGAAQVVISGTYTGASLQVDGTADNTLWGTLLTSNTNSTYSATAITTNGRIRVYRIAGLTKIRVRASALTTGSVGVAINASNPTNWIESLNSGQYSPTLPTLTSGGYGPLQVDINGRLITSTNVTIPAQTSFSFSSNIAINAGVTAYTTYTAVAQTAIKQFYAGGTGIGKQTLSRYYPSNTQYTTGGNFESAADCGTTWIWVSSGGTGSIAQSNTQANTGTFSCALTFTNSSGGNAQGVKQTFSPVLDISSWRYLRSAFFNTVSAGGAYTRTISIIITDSAANTRTYSTSGLSTASPFNTAAWIQLLGELENPTSSTGTAFDATQIANIELRMSDSGNKAGTVYWDTVRLENQMVPIVPIYHDINRSFNLVLDPVVVLAISDQIIATQRNSDATRKEYFALVSGVNL